MLLFYEFKHWSDWRFSNTKIWGHALVGTVLFAIHVKDEAVHKLYGDRIAVTMKNNGVIYHTVVLPGEEVRRFQPHFGVDICIQRVVVAYLIMTIRPKEPLSFWNC